MRRRPLRVGGSLAAAASIALSSTTAYACPNPGGPFAGAVDPRSETFTATVVSSADRSEDVPTPAPPFIRLTPVVELVLDVDGVYSGSVYAREVAMASTVLEPGSRLLFFGTRDQRGSLLIGECQGVLPVSDASLIQSAERAPLGGADPTTPQFGPPDEPPSHVATVAIIAASLFSVAALIVRRRRFPGR